MKTTLQIALIVAIVLALVFIVFSLLDYVYLAIGAVVLVLIVTAIVKVANHAKSITREPIKVSHHRADRGAEKMLKKLEKTFAICQN